MEALAGANAALLTIWDLTKMVEPDLCISDVRLLAKVGGKSGCWLNPEAGLIPNWVIDLVRPPVKPTLAGITAEVIVLSDRASSGVYEDKSGPIARDLLTAMGADVLAVSVIPDEPAELQAKIKAIKATGTTRLIITSGGTGVSELTILVSACFASPALAVVISERIGFTLIRGGMDFFSTGLAMRVRFFSLGISNAANRSPTTSFLI